MEGRGAVKGAAVHLGVPLMTETHANERSPEVRSTAANSDQRELKRVALPSAAFVLPATTNEVMFLSSEFL